MKSLKAILGIALSIGGLGTTAAVAGVSMAAENNVVQANADGDLRVYLDINEHFSTWANPSGNDKGSEGFKLFAYYWGGSSTADPWPGIEVTSSISKFGRSIYYIDIPSGSTSIIFSRAAKKDTSDIWSRWNVHQDKATYKLSAGYNFFQPDSDTSWQDKNSVWGTGGDGGCKYGSYKAYKATLHINGNTSTDVAVNWGNYTPDTPSVSGKIFLGWYTDSNYQTAYTASTPSADLNLYAKFENAPASDGYYLVGDANFVSDVGAGSGTPWTFESGVRMNDVTSGGNKASYTLTTTKQVIFKARYYSSSNNWWVSTTEKSDSATAIGVTINEEGNYVVPADITVTLYVFVKNANDTSSLTAGMPLDAFLTEFMDLTDGVCAGASTVEADLAVVWGTLKTEWGKLSSEDKATLVGTVASESGTDAQKVMARYDVIVKNHSSFEDFMNRKANANYTYKSSVLTPSIKNSANGTIIVVTAISVISLTALGAFFILRKKKFER